MSYIIKYSPEFAKSLKKLAKRYPSIIDDLNDLIKTLKENSNQGVDLGGGFRKIRLRISSKGKGKSAGARVITFNFILCNDMQELILVAIYDKSDRENISMKEIKSILKGYNNSSEN